VDVDPELAHSTVRIIRAHGAACRAGVIGAFPTANCRAPEELDAWLRRIRDTLKAHEDATGRAAVLPEPHRAPLEPARAGGPRGLIQRTTIRAAPACSAALGRPASS
jgi:NAD(P)H-dependent flavin oxidoreductase YrpB (nitropropane dioxygenase family)